MKVKRNSHFFRVIFSKKAQIAVSKSVKIITSIVLGALLLTGGTMTIKQIVLPTTTTKVEDMFNYDGNGDLGGSDGLSPSVDVFDDGYCTYSYYDSIENAITDANNHTTENANADEVSGVAQIVVRESDDMYIVSPLSDVTISNPIEISNTLTFDANGKNVELLKGAYFNITGSADVSFRDSGNGKIFKDTDSTDMEYLIDAESADCQIQILNGEYNCKTNGAVYNILSMGKLNITSANIYTESTGNKGCVSIMTSNTLVAANTTIQNVGVGDTRGIVTSSYISLLNCNISSYSVNKAMCVWGQNVALNDMEPNLCGNINGGKYTAISANATAKTISNINNIQNATILSDYQNKNGLSNGSSVGVSYTKSGETTAINISDCSVIADFCPVDKTKNIDTGCVGIIASYTIPASSMYISNCNVKGVREGMTLGIDSIINGGTYVGVQHGGAYFCADIVVNNAVFKQWDYDGQYNVTTDNYYWDNNSNFYVGSNFSNPRVFMNNCVIDNFKYCVVRTTNNYWDAFLYLSNMNLGNIRIDGINESGYSGYCYMGKNVSYNSYDAWVPQGIGIIDNETYKDIEFTEEYVKNNVLS